MSATELVKLACQLEVMTIPLNKILSMRLIEAAMKRTAKYKCIASSVRELGLIEPLVVHPKAGRSGMYMLLDGHARLEVLKELGQQTARCLVSTDDEAFTYNHKISRLSAIQEHFMILRAIKSGVSEERIAMTLNIDVANIRNKRDLLDGICPEAVQILREKRTTAVGLRELRKVKPMRQIEMAELMCASHNFSVAYARCLVAATPQEQLSESERPKETNGLTPDEIARMEHEMETLGREFKLIEESHGRNMLDLVLLVGYLRKLLDNARVVRFLSQNYSEILSEFQKIVESRALLDAGSEGAA
jgi:hypothetical protein